MEEMKSIKSLTLVAAALLLAVAGSANCTVREDIKAGFSADPVSGDAPLEVTFSDESEGNPTAWDWDFGDAESSTGQNPVHTYIEGTYDVTLAVSNAGGSDSITREGYITVVDTATLPTAEFSASPLTGEAPLSVVFTDLSSGNPSSWVWDFGDGSSATEQNPAHVYTDAGSYDVTLVVANDNGADTMFKTGYITVSAAPEYKEITQNNITLKWMVSGSNLKVIVSAPTTGWVSVGFDPTQNNHKDANIIIGYVADGSAYIQDNWGTGSFIHAADEVLGGTDDVTDPDGTENAGTTEISFTIPLDSGDAFDRPLTVGQTYTVILGSGLNGADNFTSGHLRTAVVQIEI